MSNLRDIQFLIIRVKISHFLNRYEPTYLPNPRAHLWLCVAKQVNNVLLAPAVLQLLVRTSTSFTLLCIVRA